MEMTSTSHTTGEAKVTTHYWGYRELSVEEVTKVAGGDGSDYADYADYTDAQDSAASSSSSSSSSAADDGYAAAAYGVTGQQVGFSSCFSNANVANANTAYAACNALQDGLCAISTALNFGWAQTLSVEVGQLCRTGVDNVLASDPANRIPTDI